MLGIGGRGPAIQCLLRSLLVVFAPPCFDDCPGVQQVGEPVFVEALVAQTTVEGFDVGVLVRLARFDQPQLYAVFVRHVTIALPQNSLPLSVRMTLGKPRLSASRSSTG